MSWKVSYNNMAKQRTIRWKAFFMLLAFAASFTVFCHCEAAAPRHSCCCEREKKEKKDDHGCQGMQAVKLNLQDKQAAAAFHLEALPMVLVEQGADQRVPAAQERKGFSGFWSYKHSPPNRQSLYQCFLI
jgi:hypothetical protein